jgi:uncharacterized protein YndB with AHSA1/START domain
MEIRISIQTTQPLAGTATADSRGPLRFEGWLELLRVLSALVGLDGGSDGEEHKGKGGAIVPKASFAVKRDELRAVMERTFDAPREAVFKAFTDPDAIPGWWGLRNQTTTVDKMEVKEGGAWRFVCYDESGNEYAFHGVYEKVDPPKLLSSTFNFEGIPGDHELLETVVFEDLGGTTKVTSTAVYGNLEDLEGMVASGWNQVRSKAGIVSPSWRRRPRATASGVVATAGRDARAV